MNIDIRLSVGFWQHPKTKKTARRLGLDGVRSLQVLWLWAAVNRADGKLSGMDWEDIEMAADWDGEEQKFFNTCLGLWIDQTEEGYALHDWQEHNSWAAEADDRSDRARFSRLATVNRAAFDEMKAAGVNAISKEDYERLTTAQRPSNVRSNDRPTNDSGAPTPSPAPSPSPSPNPEEENTPPTQESLVLQDHACAPAVGGGCGEDYFEPAGVDEKTPNIEFQEIRQAYNEQGRAEAPLAGLKEYRALKTSRQWPGQSAIFSAIDLLSLQDGPWREGKAPGLAKFLVEQWWRMKPRPARASPLPAPGGQGRLAQRNAATSMRVLAELEAENEH